VVGGTPSQQGGPVSTLKALFLNCTLKRSPAVSHTEGLARKIIEWFDTMDVESEMVRVVDYHVPTGTSSDEGEGDEWPVILEKVKAADLIVTCTPIWFAVRSSVCQLAIERLAGTHQERKPAVLYPLSIKATAVMVTGKEDDAPSA